MHLKNLEKIFYNVDTRDIIALLSLLLIPNYDKITKLIFT